MESTVILLPWGDKKSQPNDRRDITVSDFQISPLVFSSVIRLKLYWDLFFLHQYDTKLEFRGSSLFDLSFFFKFFCFFFRPRKYRKFNHPQALGPKFPAEKNKLADHCRVNSYKLSICHQLLHFMSQRAARLGTFKEDGSSTTVNWIMCLSTSLWVLECDVICFLIE